MSFLKRLRSKAEDLAEKHGDKIEKGIDKAAEVADKRTRGKHADKIQKVAGKAKDFVDDAGDQDAKADKRDRGDEPKEPKGRRPGRDPGG